MLSHYCTPAEERRVDAWRKDVADRAAPVVIRRDDRAFRAGVPAPVQTYVDDGLEFKRSRNDSAFDYEPSYDSRRPRHNARRSSSDHGYIPRRNSVRTSSRAGPDAYSRPRNYESYDRRGSSTKGASIWSSLLPARRNSRSLAPTHDRPPLRTRSPEYVYEGGQPDITVYSSRPKSQYAPPRAPRKEYVVQRSGTTKSNRSRRDSFGVENRMRLLDLRDRVRDEVERMKTWQAPVPTRRHDYDRRSSYY
jgi:hypothetical protein